MELIKKNAQKWSINLLFVLFIDLYFHVFALLYQFGTRYSVYKQSRTCIAEVRSRDTWRFDELLDVQITA